MIKVIGRQTPERIFILAGELDMAKTKDYKTLKPLHKKFLHNYRAQDWEKCLGAIPKLRDLAKSLGCAGYYDVMEARIKGYQINPPPKDWDGVYVATSK